MQSTDTWKTQGKACSFKFGICTLHWMGGFEQEAWGVTAEGEWCQYDNMSSGINSQLPGHTTWELLQNQQLFPVVAKRLGWGERGKKKRWTLDFGSDFMDSCLPKARDFEDSPCVKEVCVESLPYAWDGSGPWRDNKMDQVPNLMELPFGSGFS